MATRPPVFIGRAAEQAFRAFTIAAATSRPLMVVGEPGTGKTDPLLAATSFFVGGDEQKVWRRVLGEGTAPSIIEGTIDVQSLVRDDRVTLTKKGTPFDPNVKVVFLDEITRANLPTLSALLPLFDWKENRPPPVRVATSNFSIDEVGRMRRAGHALHALNDRIGLQLWVLPPDNISMEHAFVSAVVRRVTQSFAEHQWNAPITPHETALPRDYEIESFHAFLRSEPMRRVMFDAAQRTRGNHSSLLIERLKNLQAEAGRALGGPVSNRRLSTWCDMGLHLRAFSVWRSINPSRWREAHASNHPDAWRSYLEEAIASARSLTGANMVEELSPLLVEAIQWSDPSPDPTSARDWQLLVLSVFGGSAQVHRLVHEVYHVCVQSTAPSPSVDITSVSPKIQELLAEKDPFPAKLAILYVTLAERIMAASPDERVRLAHIVNHLEPRVWPLDHDAMTLANQLFSDLRIDEDVQRWRTRVSTKARRVG